MLKFEYVVPPWIRMLAMYKVHIGRRSKCSVDRGLVAATKRAAHLHLSNSHLSTWSSLEAARSLSKSEENARGVAHTVQAQLVIDPQPQWALIVT